MAAPQAHHKQKPRKQVDGDIGGNVLGELPGLATTGGYQKHLELAVAAAAKKTGS